MPELVPTDDNVEQSVVVLVATGMDPVFKIPWPVKLAGYAESDVNVFV